MIKNKYGEFSEEQFEEYKSRLHSKIHWLLIYQDPKCEMDADDLSFSEQFKAVMREIDSLNRLLSYPVEIVELMVLLQSAWIEKFHEDYNFWVYRKYILDAHSLVDKLFNIESKESKESKEGVRS